MHIADFSVGMLGANGVVAAGMPIAVGAAHALKLQRPRRHRGLLLRRRRHQPRPLPGRAELGRASTSCRCCSSARTTAGRATTAQRRHDGRRRRCGARAASLGMPASTVDGNDVRGGVDAAGGRLVADVRAGAGPRLLHAVTYRVKGQSRWTRPPTATPHEVAAALQTDPIARARQHAPGAAGRQRRDAGRHRARGAGRDRRRPGGRRGRALARRRAPPTPTCRTPAPGRGDERRRDDLCRRPPRWRWRRRWRPTRAWWCWARTWAAAASSASTRGCRQRFGAQRVIDTPISEATIMGAGVGMALAGLRPVVEMRVVDFALCAHGRDRQPGRQEPLHVRRPGPRAAGGAHAHRHVVGVGGAALAVAGEPGSRTCRAWWWCARPRRRTTTALLRAALACGDPVVYMEHKELWGQTRRGATPTHAVALGKAQALRAGQRPDAGQLVAAVHGLRRRPRERWRSKASRPR